MDRDGKTQSTQTRAAFHGRRNRAAIDAVTKAGLTVQSVEITNSGSIKIETQSLPKQRTSTPKTAPDAANAQDEILKKKQA